MTIRRLLSHTAGLGDGLGYQGFAPDEQVQSLEQSGLVTVLCRSPISLCYLGFECERADAA